ncbi:MAG TPA: ImmA/IrrE family metallo-endopeptidase [Chloroflexia bacterium]|nr:ImmA/IrrE family metallo-endopeptidase [Chloroflexia bacterium]
MNELWLQETAETFWQAAGGFSTDFEYAALCALPLSVERLPGLSIKSARRFLTQQGFSGNQTFGRLPDRPLRACLATLDQDLSFVLLDAGDSAEEQNFSLAHEVAHYLLDYREPRHKALKYFPPAILETLDARRSPTPEERWQSALGNISLRPHLHLMERSGTGDILSGQTLRAEERADRLALELLAPQEEALGLVIPAIQGLKSYLRRLAAAQEILANHFRLPLPVAQEYARLLLPEAGAQESFREWLGQDL